MSMDDASCLTRKSQAQVPVQWAANLTTSTVAACSVSDCSDNRSIMQSCCSQYQQDSNNATMVEELNTYDGLYLTCSISADYTGFNESSTENSPYQSFQDCLINNSTGPLLCNRPRHRGDSVPSTPASCTQEGSMMPPQRVAPGNNGTAICGMRHDENSTAALKQCCGDSTLQAYGLGCFASCVGDGKLEDCLKDQYQGDGDGGLSCAALSDTSDAMGRRLNAAGWLLLCLGLVVALQ